jgi:hypothetical protein
VKWLLEGALPGTVDPAGQADANGQEERAGDDAVKMLYSETGASKHITGFHGSS